MKKLVLGVIVIVFMVALVGLWKSVLFLTSGPEAAGQDKVFEVLPGQGFYQVAERLKEEGLVTSAIGFKILARVTGDGNRLRIGEYAVRTDLRPMALLDILTSGKSIERQITFPEGWNRYEMAQLVEEKGIGSRTEFLALTSDKNLIQELLGEKLDSLEGYLFPETYKYTKFSSLESLVRSMVAGFLKAFDSLQFDPSKGGLTRHQFVTLASVIEKETGAESDRPLISSVFHNRLKRGMRLQSDPTILYGLLVERGVMPENIKREDILHPSPYNTYTVSGIPYGPIANPGVKALMAAAFPAASDFYYFVSRNDGTTSFSESLADHNSAVQKFQVNREARDGKSWRDLQKKKAESAKLPAKKSAKAR